MSLKDALLEQRSRSLEKFGAERAAVLEAATDALAAEVARRPLLKVGDKAPDFMLPNVHGRPVSLSAQTANGPVVLSFYRGGWCPYCNIQLRALQQVLPVMSDLGASLIAIAPQGPDDTLSTAEKNDLAFEVLSDSACAVADAYGIAFELPDNLKEIYTDIGNVLPDRNAADDWRLPIPATFVIDRDGTLALVDIDADYRVRAEPDDILAVLKRLSAGEGREMQAAKVAS